MQVKISITNPLSIRVEPLHHIGEAIKSGETKLEIEGDNLLNLLLRLNDKYSSLLGQLVDCENKKVVNYDVFINKQYYECFPEGIYTELKEGDEIEIMIPVIGGG